MEILDRILNKKNYHWSDLGHNFTFVISAVSCYVLMLRFHLPYMISFFAACLAAVMVAMSVSDIYDMVKKKSRGIRIWALMTGFATVPVNAEYFFWRTTTSDGIVAIIERSIPGGLNTARVFCYVAALLAVYFWYVVMCFVCDWLWKIIKTILAECSKQELVLAAVIIVLLCGAVICIFYLTSIFHQGVYNADTGDIIDKNAYLVLPHMANDLRQPLFALFAAPFVGPGFLVSWFVPGIMDISVLAVMLIQVPLLVLDGLIFVNIASDDIKIRWVLLLVYFSTCPALLFAVMTEQYVVSVFWLLIYIYFVTKKGKRIQEAMVGAAGTLLTSAALVPFLWEESHNNIKELLGKIVETGLLGGFTVVLFGRLEVFLTPVKQMKEIGQFLGARLSLGDKILQYIKFARTCLIFPESGTQVNEWTAWSVDYVTRVDVLGVVIIILAFIGFWMNRKDVFAKISMYWIFFSMFIIVIAGWGAEENCAILYSLYLGWAFIGLIWKLLMIALKKIRLIKLIYPLGIIVSFVFLSLNIHAIVDLMNFAMQYYPK